jgi:hypothetical protein
MQKRIKVEVFESASVIAKIEAKIEAVGLLKLLVTAC